MATNFGFRKMYGIEMIIECECRVRVTFYHGMNLIFVEQFFAVAFKYDPRTLGMIWKKKQTHERCVENAVSLNSHATKSQIDPRIPSYPIPPPAAPQPAASAPFPRPKAVSKKLRPSRSRSKNLIRTSSYSIRSRSLQRRRVLH